MSHHAATFQSVFDKAVTAYDFVCAMADRIYWLDDTYVQPFYAWAVPRLRDVAISGLFWGLIALIDVALWLAATTRQFMARDAQAIALSAFAQAHEPLPEFPALTPAAVPLALPSVVGLLLPMASAPGLDLVVSDGAAPVLALCPTRMPMSLRSSINPDDSVRRWLAAALPLVMPLVVEAAPVVVLDKTPRKAKATAHKTDAAKTPRQRSHKAKKATATAR
jgi:hypothetical protein